MMGLSFGKTCTPSSHTGQTTNGSDLSNQLVVLPKLLDIQVGISAATVTTKATARQTKPQNDGLDERVGCVGRVHVVRYERVTRSLT
jgi:hypothetical protein